MADRLSPDKVDSTPMKSALSQCETAFKEWLIENRGQLSRDEHTSIWQAFRAGWYAKQGNR